MAANDIPVLSTSNTFGQLLVTTNALVKQANLLNSGVYVKEGGDIRVLAGGISLEKTSGTTLTVASDATFGGTISSKTIINSGDLTVQGQNALFSNATGTVSVTNNVTASNVTARTQLISRDLSANGYVLASGLNLENAPTMSAFGEKAAVNIANRMLVSNSGNVDVQGTMVLSKTSGLALNVRSNAIFAGEVAVRSALPILNVSSSGQVAILQIQSTTGTTDNNVWHLRTVDSSGKLRLQAQTDALTGGGSVLDINRNAQQITGIDLSVSSSNDALRITQTGSGRAFVVEDETNPDGTPFVIDAGGNVGIGTTATTFAKMALRRDSSRPDAEYGLYSTFRSSATSGSNNKFAIQGDVGTSAGYTASSILTGISGIASHETTGTIAQLRGVSTYIQSIGSGTVTNAYQFLTQEAGLGTGGSNTITNLVGYWAGDMSSGTNNYAFYSNLSAAPNKWGFYSGGTANSFFNGSLGLGTTTELNSYKLNVLGDSKITGNVVVVNTTAGDALRINQTGTGNAFVVEDSTNPDATPFVIDAGGNVGIGTTFTTSHRVTAAHDGSLTTTAQSAILGDMYATATSGTSDKVGINGFARAWTGYAGTGSIIGVSGTGSHEIAGTLGQVRGFSSLVRSIGTGTVTNAFQYYAQDGNLGTGGANTITNLYGYFVTDLTVGTNNYGFYGNINAGANKWNTYNAGTANNYFNGSVGIGIAGPTSKLHVVGDANVTTSLTVSGMNVTQTITSAYGQANTATTIAQAAYGQANAAFTQANGAFAAANSAANSVLVSANTGSTLAKVGLNFNNTSSVSVSVGAGTGTATGNANVSFSVVLTDSVTSTSTGTAATPNSVKTAYDQATNAYNMANSTVTVVSANSGPTLSNVSLNFVNTSTVQVSVGSAIAGVANISFTSAADGVTSVATGVGLTGGTITSTGTISANIASTTGQGVTKLIDSVTTNDAANAATGAAVKTAYDQATNAYGRANTGVNAVSVSTGGTNQLIEKQLNFNSTANILVSVVSGSGSNANISFDFPSTLPKLTVTDLTATSLTVTNPIIAPSESDSASYRLRVSQTTRGDGYFGVNQGGANGNAYIRFASSAGNVWQVTANSIEGTYYNIITSQNVSSSVTSTSTVNVASSSAVKSAFDQAITAYGQANAAFTQANTANSIAIAAYGQANAAYSTANSAVVRVAANSGTTLSNVLLNFINTSSVQVSVTSPAAGIANISFTSGIDGVTSVATGLGLSGGTITTTGTISANVADTTVQGITKLINSVTSTDSGNAATGSAVKTAYDQATNAYNTANTSGNTVAVYANSTLILSRAPINFNNTSSVRVNAQGSGSNFTNVSFSVVSGPGSGLDADTLDGINSASFVRSDANTVGNIGLSGVAPYIRLESNDIDVFVGQEIASILFSTVDASAGGSGDKGKISAEAEGSSGGASLNFFSAVDGGSAKLGASLRGNNDLRLYASDGTAGNFHSIRSQATATSSLTLPSGDIVLKSGTMANTLEVGVAYSTANAAANATRVSANSGSTLSNVSLNFVNTSTVSVSVTSTPIAGIANIAFTSLTLGGTVTQVNTGIGLAGGGFTTFGTITANIADTTVQGVTKLVNSVTSTDAANAATASAVKTAYDQATLAYGQANSSFTAANNAANTVRVTANSGSTQSAVSLNFINTASVQVSVGAGVAGTANVSVSAVSGSTTVPGILQLTDSTTSTSTTTAATPNSVKSAYDQATLAYAAANTGLNKAQVSANGGSVQSNVGVNFNNTSTVQVSVGSGTAGNANVSFSVIPSFTQLDVSGDSRLTGNLNIITTSFRGLNVFSTATSSRIRLVGSGAADTNKWDIYGGGGFGIIASNDAENTVTIPFLIQKLGNTVDSITVTNSSDSTNYSLRINGSNGLGMLVASGSSNFNNTVAISATTTSDALRVVQNNTTTGNVLSAIRGTKGVVIDNDGRMKISSGTGTAFNLFDSSINGRTFTQTGYTSTASAGYPAIWVAGSQPGAASILLGHYEGTIPSNKGGLTIHRSRGYANGTLGALNTFDVIGAIDFTGDTGSNINCAAAIVATCQGVGTDYVSGSLDFRTSQNTVQPQTRMRIANTGNVGINLGAGVNPSYTLHVSGSSYVGGTSTIDGGTLANTANSTADAFSVYAGTGNGLSLKTGFVRRADGNTWTTAAARIQSLVDVTWQSYIDFNGNNNDAGLSFGTGASTVNSNQIPERMRIANTGIVTINNLSGAGSRTVTADATGALSAASDASLKQEVPEAKIPGLNEIVQVQPKAYKWLSAGDNAPVEIGFFANQVAPIIPSAAPMGDDGLYGFYDRSMIAALVKSVQELKDIVDAQAIEISDLKTRVKTLEGS